MDDTKGISRRGFIKAAAVTGAAAGLGMGPQAADAQPKSVPEPKTSSMRIGMLTGPFGNEKLEKIIEFAAKNDIDALEVAAGPGSGQLDFNNLTDVRVVEIKKALETNGVVISGLSWYENLVDPAHREERVRYFHNLIDAAAKLDVGVVNTLGGFPAPGKNKMKTIEEDCAVIFPPLAEYAKSKNVKIALENYFATVLQGLTYFDKMFEVVPNDNFGLNLDPSHLAWQQIDYIAAVERYGKRIFHTHAKDVEVRQDHLSFNGSLTDGWWRYVIPGFGIIAWGKYVAALRRTGYRGVLSIEHEDGTFDRDEGFIRGKTYLRTLI